MKTGPLATPKSNGAMRPPVPAVPVTTVTGGEHAAVYVAGGNHETIMEEIAAQTYCQRAALELAALVKHQRRPRGRARQQSALLWRYIQEVLTGGVRADRLQEGPWTVGTRKLKKPGRGGLLYIPFVERGRTVIMVSTPGEAEDLAAFLNYCGTEEFTSR